MLESFVISVGPLINQSLSAAIAIIAGSFFLYSLVNDFDNKAARSFSILLLFVTITYIGDLGVSYSSNLESAALWLQFQWLGIAFVPAVYVNLSHAILTMTGLTSRGRRSWTVRLLYVTAAAFLAMVWWTDWIVRDLAATPAPHFLPGPIFWLFALYFVSAVILSFWFMLRAQRRTLIRASRRRVTYLLAVYAAPALAVFPFLLISGQSLSSPLVFYGMLILVDTVLAVMLTFMAYSMAFQGTLLPERLIKAQMLQFFLRGPVVAIATLAVIAWVPRATAVLGLPGEEVMPLIAVTTILSLQWGITRIRPFLERFLVYVGDQGQIRRIQELERRLLTGADFEQLLDTILVTLCEALRVESAFVASLTGEKPVLERAIGLNGSIEDALEKATALSSQNANGLPVPDDITSVDNFLTWEDYYLVPLHFIADEESEARIVGVLGVAKPDVTLDEDARLTLMALATRSAEVLEDRRLQSEVLAAVEGLLPEIAAVQARIGERSDVQALTAPREDVISSPDFNDKIKAALAHYWGGPRLTDASLMNLAVVRQALAETDGNPQRAMRAVLETAIENLRPEGQRSMTTAEWIMYNILEMRFVQGRKVRDVALRMAMSEADFYRKQRVAIESVAQIVADMERGIINGDMLQSED